MYSPNLNPIPELYVSYESAQKLKVEAADLVSHDLTPRQICDLELPDERRGSTQLKPSLAKQDYDKRGRDNEVRGWYWQMQITLRRERGLRPVASRSARTSDAAPTREGVILGAP